MARTFLALLAAAATLAGCVAVDNDTERAIVGAGAGAIVAKAFDRDAGAGALLGAVGGAFCDDVGACARPRGY